MKNNLLSDANSQPDQTSNLGRFAKIVNGYKRLAIFQNVPLQMFDRVLNTPIFIIHYLLSKH